MHTHPFPFSKNSEQNYMNTEVHKVKLQVSGWHIVDTQ